MPETDSVINELLILLRKLPAETARESSRAKAMEISERKHENTQDEHQQIESSTEVCDDEQEVEIADAEEIEVAEADIIEMVVVDGTGTDLTSDTETTDDIIDVEPVAVDAEAYEPLVKAA